MQKIGIHISYWQESWSDLLVPIFQKVREAGFDVAELPLLNPANMDFHGLRNKLDEVGLLASCGTGLNQATDITSPDARLRKAGIEHLEHCLEGTAILGSPVLGGVTYAPWGIFPHDEMNKRRLQCIESLKRVVEVAEKNQVCLCLEVLNRFEGYLINTVEQGLLVLDSVGSHFLKLHLDTFHMNIEEDNIPAAIIAAGKQLGHLHCVENNRKAPGQGHLPWLEIRNALQQISYKGYLVAEVFVNPKGEVGRDLFIWRKLAADLDSNAIQIAKFLREELAYHV